MYGPTYQIKLEIGQEYDIPHGYGSDGYMYNKGKFIGIIEKSVSYWSENKFFVFELLDNKGWMICLPSIRISGYHLDITFDPKSFGETLEQALENFNPKYKWDSHWGEVKDKEFPDLGKFKKI